MKGVGCRVRRREKGQEGADADVIGNVVLRSIVSILKLNFVHSQFIQTMHLILHVYLKVHLLITVLFICHTCIYNIKIG